MKTLFAAAGIGLFLFCSVQFVRGYGIRWRWGRLGMPEVICPADPVNQWAAASGWDQELMWGGVLILAIWVCVVASLLRACLRLERQARHTREEIRRILEQRR